MGNLFTDRGHRAHGQHAVEGGHNREGHHAAGQNVNQANANADPANQPHREIVIRVGDAGSENVDESEKESEDDKIEGEIKKYFDPNGKLTLTEKGCAHYRRNCQLHCYQWDKFYPCRFCHDEYEDTHFNVKTNHKFDRFGVKKVKCLECDNEQVPSESCENCHKKFGNYYWLKCNFFDDLGIGKKTFHCDEWKICRVGGRDNYFHCNVCNACVSNSMRDNHSCANFDQPWCIWQEGFYNVKDGALILKCKHIVHSKCFKSWCNENYTCPLCKKSFVDDETQKLIDSQIENEMRLYNMGEHGKIMVKIICNEWGQKSEANFHVLGHKCANCNSYNTTKIK